MLICFFQQGQGWEFQGPENVWTWSPVSSPGAIDIGGTCSAGRDTGGNIGKPCVYRSGSASTPQFGGVRRGECGVPPEQEDPAMAVRSSAGLLATSSRRVRAAARPFSPSPPSRGRAGARKSNPVGAKALPAAVERSGSRAGPGAAVRSSRRPPTLDAGTVRLGRVSSRSLSPPWMGGRDHASARSTTWAAGKPARASGIHAAAGADTTPQVPLVAAASAPAKRRRLNTPARESRSFALAAVSDDYRHRVGLDDVRADDRGPGNFSEPEDSDHLSVQVKGVLTAWSGCWSSCFTVNSSKRPAATGTGLFHQLPPSAWNSRMRRFWSIPYHLRQIYQRRNFSMWPLSSRPHTRLGFP